MPTQEPTFDQAKTKEYPNLESFPSTPKEEGLRPGGRYVGGAEDEIIVVNGIKYKKETAYPVEKTAPGGKVISTRPATEYEYFAHSTETAGPGPGWDSRNYYMDDGWGEFGADPRKLSDLPLYRLVRLE